MSSTVPEDSKCIFDELEWRRDLTKARMNLKLPVHTLVADSVTRWGSIAKMVAWIFEQENAIRTVLTADRKASHLLPTWQDIQVLTAIQQALSPLSTLTDILLGEEYVTMSAILPMLQPIETRLFKDEADDTRLTKDIGRCIKQNLSSHYTIPNGVEDSSSGHAFGPRVQVSFQ